MFFSNIYKTGGPFYEIDAGGVVFVCVCSKHSSLMQSLVIVSLRRV